MSYCCRLVRLDGQIVWEKSSFQTAKYQTICSLQNCLSRFHIRRFVRLRRFVRPLVWKRPNVNHKKCLRSLCRVQAAFRLPFSQASLVNNQLPYMCYLHLNSAISREGNIFSLFVWDVVAFGFLQCLIWLMIKVAQNSFQHFPRHRFWWVIITTLYQLMLQSWYQKTAQLLVNTLVLFSWHYRLP